MTWITFVAAVLPALWLVRYFVTRDVFPEPRKLVIKTFLLGIAIVVPVCIVAIPAHSVVETIANPYLHGVSKAFFAAAIPEELMKLWVVARVCAKWAEFDEPMDGLVYGATASLGFAMLENVLYVSEGGMSVAVLRAFTAVPAHACFGAIMGYYVARARFDSANKSAHMRRAFLVPMLLHGLYDVPPMVMMANGDELTTGVTIVGIILFLVVLIGMIRRVRTLVQTMRTEQLAR
jgi:RsiW-degrading membrane proteinase PrsW (M82 family)